MTRTPTTRTAWCAAIAATLLCHAASAGAQNAVGGETSAASCIAIVLPSARGVEGDATAFATSLRDLLVSYLTGPTLRAITLDARLASQAIEEARQKQCGHVLLTSVIKKRNDGSDLGRVLGRAAGTAAVYGIPYGGGAAAAAARGAAVAGASAVSTLADTTRAKDEVTLEYRLGPADTALVAPPWREKVKARRDGEDLLTPLVEKAAEAIAAAVLTR